MKLLNRFPLFLPLLVLLAILASPLLRAQTLMIGTGVAGNSYDVMMGQALGRCNANGEVGAQNTTGTLQNIDYTIGNKQELGIGQEDALFLRKTSDANVNKLMTLFSLHPEEIHVVAPINSGLFQKKSTLGFERQGDPVVFTGVEQLAGFTVAAGGGSYDTARLIASNTGIGFNVLKAKDNADALRLVKEGKAQAVLAVAGAPSGWVSDLPAGQYKMLSFKQATIERLVAIYSGAQVSYDNLGAEGVKTVSTNAVLFTRQFTDPKMIDALARLRRCLQDAVPVLQNTRNTHPKWQDVNPNAKSKWPWYDLPVAGAATRR